MISGIQTALVSEKGLIWSGRPKRPSQPKREMAWEQKSLVTTPPKQTRDS